MRPPKLGRIFALKQTVFMSEQKVNKARVAELFNAGVSGLALAIVMITEDSPDGITREELVSMLKGTNPAWVSTNTSKLAEDGLIRREYIRPGQGRTGSNIAFYPTYKAI